MSPATSLGQIITFYSYKGGTGRSMALANTACLLANACLEGERVLMMDWDLEAPGLHRYFHNRLKSAVAEGAPALEEQPGLIDLLYELDRKTRRLAAEGQGHTEEAARQMLGAIDFQEYAVETTVPSLYLMTAGRLDTKYASRVNAFQWEEFFDRSPWLISTLAEFLARKYRYVLVDSRTGTTDISGICTMLLPERLVVAFTPNRQSLTGVMDLIKNATDYRRQSDDLRPLVVFPLASRVEPAEPTLRIEWRSGSTFKGIDGYQGQFERLFTEIYSLAECDLTQYFDEVQIQHVPRYAYGEEIAFLVESSADRLSLTRSYANFTQRLITLSGPWENPNKGQQIVTSEGTVVDAEVPAENTVILPEYARSGGVDINVSGTTSITGDVVGRDKILNSYEGAIIGYTVDQVNTLIEKISSTFQPKPFDGRCPYVGLEHFSEEDADRFFGRKALTDELLARVEDSRFVAIAGPSGSGKSSLVRAGLLHALRQGALPNSDRWLYATFTPGRDPIESLALAVSRLARLPEAGEYLRARHTAPETLNQSTEALLSDQPDQRAILFVDQFEEVFTQAAREEERVAFLNLLTHAATIETGRVTILLAIRSDFVSDCAAYPQLNALLNQQFIQVGALQPDELVSAIAQPALQVGLRIEPDLVAQIANDMRDEPGALPLMQFVLKDLFDAQQAAGGVIALTLNDYLEHGGLQKALERHADAAFASLSAEEQQLARTIFSGLVEVGHGNEDTRRTVTLDELLPVNGDVAQIQAVSVKLADARLIITGDREGTETVTLAHESLIVVWPWLRQLIDENREVIALHNQVAEDAQAWVDHQRDASYLYIGAKLAAVQEELTDQRIALSSLAQSFVESGIEYKRKQALAQRQRVFIGTFLFIAGALLSVIVNAVLTTGR